MMNYWCEHEKNLPTINIPSIIEYLAKHIEGLEGIYLFGSYASGDATEGSDIDIAILCKNRLSFGLKATILQDLNLLTGKAVDLVELRYVDTFFQEEIITTGQLIVTFNKDLCERFEDYIYSAALDFRNFRKSHVEEIIARGSIHG